MPCQNQREKSGRNEESIVIAHLTGTLNVKSPEYVVLDVNGVGYGLFVTLNTFYDLPDIGTKITLLTYTHVREDALQLYGFLSLKERLMFEKLIGVSKIGPKLARNILSKLSAEDLKSAIVQADAGLIHSIPGIGEKTAQRLILELKDKISRPDISEEDARYDILAKTHEKDGSLFTDAVSALVNLGYPKHNAQKAVQSCVSSRPSGIDSLKDLIKHSLDLLSR
ncbi:Holliday junction branch migration protein RuvA [bacterium]|nr:Holliday junction branch migration protein RuvA [bacterium]